MGSEHTFHTGERILRLPDVQARVGLSRSAIYERMARGDFPRAVSLGGYKAVGWRSTEVEEWIASRPLTTPRAGRT